MYAAAAAVGFLTASLIWVWRRPPRGSDVGAAEVLEHIDDLVIRVDRDERIVYVNAAYERSMGFDRRHEAGRSIWERWPDLADGTSEDELRRRIRTRRRVGSGILLSASRSRSMRILPIQDGGVLLLSRVMDVDQPAEPNVTEERIPLSVEAAGLGTIVGDFDATSTPSTDGPTKAEELPDLSIAEPVDEPVDEHTIMTILSHSDYAAVKAASVCALRPDGDTALRLQHRAIWLGRSLRWTRAYAGTTFDLRHVSRTPSRDVGMVRDTTAQHEADAHLFAATQRLQSLMDVVPVGISFSTDATCREITGNAAVHAQFRAAPGDNLSASALTGEAHGRRIRYIANGRELSDEALPLQRAVAENGIVGPMELEIHMPDGRRWFAEAWGAPVRGARGETIGGLAVTIDITQRKLAEQALIEADRRKDEFLAVLSHELRNPLAPIRSVAYVLKRDDVDRAERIRAADVIERQISVMVRLLEDLLDISRIRHGRFELRKRHVTIQHVVKLAIESSRPAIDAARHRISVDIPAEDLWLDADTVRLAQVFSNLLNNAAKYTPSGGRIALSVVADDAYVSVAVKDNGVGIDPDWLPRLFEMFARAPGVDSQSKEGLGVGLSLVRAIVDMHGGTVEASSEGAGKGSVFEVRVPRLMHAATAAGAKIEGSEPMRSALLRRVVVIADDNRSNADCLAAALTMAGHNVHVVYGGREAIAAAVELRPDAMLIDIGMPDVDGYAVCRAIRAQPDGHRIRMMAVTGWGREEDRERTRSEGFDLHLVKPVHPDDILEMLA